MKSKPIAAILIASVLLTQAAIADVWRDIAGYNYGDEPNPCEQAETLLQETPATQYRPIEDKLIAVIKSEASTQDGKSIACRFLQQIGTERCIPAVSELLDDKVLCHYARLVLERLESESADKAMRDALLSVPDAAKIGILGSLGARRDRKAVAQVSKLTVSRNAAVAAAAIETLGKIGRPEAAQRLSSMKPPKKLQPIRMRAMVACARSLPDADAVALCQKVLAGSDTSSQIAAMKQLAIADPTEAVPVISKAIKGGDVRMRRGALTVVADTKDRSPFRGKLTAAMIDVLTQLPRERKAELIVALGSRGDTAALKPVSRYVSSEDVTTRCAAVKAVSKLGDADMVKLLLRAADSPQMSMTVTRAIVGMKGDRIDAVLVDSLGDDNLTRPAIKACVARGCTEAVPTLLKLAQDQDPDIRKEAWAGLGALAADSHIDAMMDIVLDIKDTPDLDRAKAAIKSIFARSNNRSKCFQAVAARYPQAGEAIKAMILDLGAAVGDSRALELQRKALKSSNERLSAAALRALGRWPNASAADDLLELARNASETVDQIVALKGYIRIAGLDKAKLSKTERVRMLKTAMNLATRPEEKKQIIGALQNVRSIESLKMLRHYLDDSALKAEAQMSAVNLLWDMRRSKRPEVKAIAERLADSKNRRVADKAKRALKDMNKNK
jgi:HEAT repeat protein